MSFKKIVQLFKKKPCYCIKMILFRLIAWFLPDRIFLKNCFRIKVGNKLNIENPKTFSEKLQWLKLYDRNPNYTFMVDKYKAKDYVGKIIGKEHIIPLLGVWDNAKDIDFDKLPSKFVLKCNHDSKSWVFCKNKNEFNKKRTIKFLNKKLKKNHYNKFREWPYKNIKRRIIAEEYLEDNSEYLGLTDYKFFCFNGKARMMYITHDIDINSPFDAFDMDFNHLDMFSDYNNPVTPKKPIFFQDMRKAAEKLAKGIPFVRVDFYIVNNRYYFGEMTFYPAGGFFEKQASEWNNIIGSWLKLPKKLKKRKNK